MSNLPHIASSGAVPCNCAHDPNTRLLRRVRSLEDFPLTESMGLPTRIVTVVDTETTGTDSMVDEVIDIALVTIAVDTRGEIVEIISKADALRDPGMPIPPAITMLTGITDDDVRGRTVDLDRLERALSRAEVRIAHNASFDIAFLESLLPGLRGKEWACSATDLDWFEAGFDGRKLGHLLMQAGWFNGAHRAMADVMSLLHLLAHRLEDGSTVIGHLLAAAAQGTVRFEATNAPFDRRRQLKARGYRWDPRLKVWWIELLEAECADEERWFRAEISPHGPPPRMLPLTWRQRHR